MQRRTSGNIGAVAARLLQAPRHCGAWVHVPSQAMLRNGWIRPAFSFSSLPCRRWCLDLQKQPKSQAVDFSFLFSYSDLVHSGLLPFQLCFTSVFSLPPGLTFLSSLFLRWQIRRWRVMVDADGAGFGLWFLPLLLRRMEWLFSRRVRMAGSGGVSGAPLAFSFGDRERRDGDSVLSKRRGEQRLPFFFCKGMGRPVSVLPRERRGCGFPWFQGWRLPFVGWESGRTADKGREIGWRPPTVFGWRVQGRKSPETKLVFGCFEKRWKLGFFLSSFLRAAAGKAKWPRGEGPSGGGSGFLIKGGGAAAWEMEKKVIGFLGFFLLADSPLLISSAALPFFSPWINFSSPFVFHCSMVFTGKVLLDIARFLYCTSTFPFLFFFSKFWFFLFFLYF